MSLERQLSDNPELAVTSNKSPRLQQRLNHLDNITEVTILRSIMMLYGTRYNTVTHLQFTKYGIKTE